jgi:cytosine/adenosine deaminase-related metal-dependent hydrolase
MGPIGRVRHLDAEPQLREEEGILLEKTLHLPLAIFGAFYDANVLYPSGLRNFLMHLALTGIFRAHWSAEVHDEWIRNLLKNRPDLTADKLDRTRQLMDKALPDALVTGYEHLIDSVELPDRDDRHVLAAAIHCGARVIVTLNLGDFPGPALDKFMARAMRKRACQYSRGMRA